MTLHTKLRVSGRSGIVVSRSRTHSLSGPRGRFQITRKDIARAMERSHDRFVDLVAAASSLSAASSDPALIWTAALYEAMLFGITLRRLRSRIVARIVVAHRPSPSAHELLYDYATQRRCGNSHSVDRVVSGGDAWEPRSRETLMLRRPGNG